MLLLSKPGTAMFSLCEVLCTRNTDSKCYYHHFNSECGEYSKRGGIYPSLQSNAKQK